MKTVRRQTHSRAALHCTKPTIPHRCAIHIASGSLTEHGSSHSPFVSVLCYAIMLDVHRMSATLLCATLWFRGAVRSEALIAIYGSVTSITVALMVNSMVQCNLILAAILKNGKTYVSEAEEEEFMFRCRNYSFHYMPGCRPPYPRRTFQRMWERRCVPRCV